MPYLLRRWWTRKYSLPATSDEYLRYTPEELLVEFFEDYFEAHPDRQVRQETHEGTGQRYFVTGDPVIDRWEREIAEGREPYYDAGVDLAERAAEQPAVPDEVELPAFEERFDV